VLTASVYLPEQKYAQLDRFWPFVTRLTSSLEATPGIRAAAIAEEIPPEGSSNGTVEIDGRTDTEATLVEWNYVTPDYFRAMGIPLRQGRAFTAEDEERTADTMRAWLAIKDPKEQEAAAKKIEGVAVISEAMAKRFWPDQDAVGKVFHQSSVAQRVIGVVGDVKNMGLRERPMPGAYFPLSEQFGTADGGYAIVLQAAGPPKSVLGALRQRVKDADAGLAVFDVRTVPQIVAESMTDTSYEAALLATLAALALILAAVGTYGVMAFVAAQRTNEIGIRMALGAQRGEILGMVLRQGMALVGAGIAIGWVATLGASRLMRDLLWGVAPFDPWTYAAVAAALASVAFVACYVPARRAMRVDPMVALRYE
jgi:predicted permease